MLYFYMSVRVGQMREKHGVKAPAITGHPEFERAFRVHYNTLEALVVFLPLLWLATIYFVLRCWRGCRRRSASSGSSAGSST